MNRLQQGLAVAGIAGLALIWLCRPVETIVSDHADGHLSQVIQVTQGEREWRWDLCSREMPYSTQANDTRSWHEQPAGFRLYSEIGVVAGVTALAVVLAGYWRGSN